MAAKTVGADLGNDSLKIAFGGNATFRLKNSVSQRMMEEIRKDLGIADFGLNGDFEELNDDQKGRILNDLDVVIHSDTINGRFFVGDLASRNGEQVVEPGTPKADNPNIIIPLITMLALDVERGKKEAHFKLACGLPITEFTSDRERFRKKLIGEYNVKFLSQALKDREVKIIIDDVLMIPEGVAVALNQIFDETGRKFRNKELLTGQCGVIDIGAFTTDIPVVSNGKPDNEASSGINEGIANYLDAIVNLINEQHGVKMTRSQLVEKLEANSLSFSIKGTQTDLSSYVDQQFSIFAKKIVSKVDNIWANHFEISQFFVVGGGAKALRKHLDEEMKRRKISLSFIDNEDPQMQNALGYWKYAKQKFGA
ncbi:ParM/StbA family protein [Neobacillus pocheonensis]|uniref:ParM/StbA family protein n=1 Tax=Neobacillus pocheonensis TaxID=363869 RepID=UPI003D2B32C5